MFPGWKLVFLLTATVLTFSPAGLRAQDKQFADFSLKYGYTYLTASERDLLQRGDVTESVINELVHHLLFIDSHFQLPRYFRSD